MKATLSLCMIVRDEEDFLVGCLESVREVVDEIVILDTGSSDDTIKIAEDFGAAIYTFSWRDDFSMARNESIKHAHGDWILWLDADERLIPESIPVLKGLLKPEKRPVIYEVTIKNIRPNGDSYSLSSAHRLFTNKKGIYFTGRIHEQLSPSVAKLGGEERTAKIEIYHLGYSLQGPRAEKKNMRNRNLLERMVNESPRSAYAHYTLAQHYGLNKRHKRALEHYQVAYKLNQFTPEMSVSLLNTMCETLIELGRYDEARRKLHQSITTKPFQAGGYYLLYKLAYREQNYVQAANWLEKLLVMTSNVSQRNKSISTDVIIDKDRILYTLGELYLRMEMWEKAKESFESISTSQRKHLKVQKYLLDIYLHLMLFQQAENTVVGWLAKRPKNERLLTIYGMILIKQKRFNDAVDVYETLYRIKPDDSVIARRLIGLYGKVGRLEKAQELAKRVESDFVSVI